MLYKVRVGVDEYLGTAEEVVAWMARAEGAPGGGAKGSLGYMRGIARRLRANLGIEVVDTSSAFAFLSSLQDAKVVTIEERPEASSERLDRDEIERVLGDGPLAFGKDVNPEDVEL